MNQTKKNMGISAGLILFCTLMMASNALAITLTQTIYGSVFCSQDGSSIFIDGAQVYATDCQGHLLDGIASEEIPYPATTGVTYYDNLNGDPFVDPGYFKLVIPADIRYVRLRVILSDGTYRTTDCLDTEEYAGELLEIDVYNKDTDSCGGNEGCQPCQGKVTQLTLQYRGSDDAIITVFKKKSNDPVFSDTVEAGGTFVVKDEENTLGTEISLYVPDKPTYDKRGNLIEQFVITTIHTSCSQPIGPGMVFGDFLVLGGYSQDGGLLCPQEASDSCGCDGKVTRLVLEYSGSTGDNISVVQKGGTAQVVNPQIVNGKLRITVLGGDKNLTLGTEISVFVNGSLDTKIHTSCSQPIGPGLVRGSFTVIEGLSLKGGLLCPVPAESMVLKTESTTKKKRK
ncbi:MAG: hypothetical protein K9N55_11265 [Phycisphaerae bacterium]|nr:hypothetical protein [Phycisphaerae bacterium]